MLENEIVKKPYELARQNLVSCASCQHHMRCSLMGILQLGGGLKPSFISHALQNVDNSDLDSDLDRQIQCVAATVVAGKRSFCLL